jgi:nucleoside-diphosphate-sugar epimerase
MAETPMIAITGATGFVGKAIVAQAALAGLQVRPVVSPRCIAPADAEPIVAATAWCAENRGEFESLVDQLVGCSALVNAAGLATPDSAASPELWGVNAVLPSVLAMAALQACVPRFVHVSSAAVLGDTSELGEGPSSGAFSPYSRSKAAGEAGILAVLPGDLRFCVYRPTSVIGPGRSTVQPLKRVLLSSFFLAPAGGSATLPVAHVDNVGAGCIFLATHRSASIVLHPWEDITTSGLAKVFGRVRPIISTPSLLDPVLKQLLSKMIKIPVVGPKLRRLQLLWFGQGQKSSLPELGYFPVTSISLENL